MSSPRDDATPLPASVIPSRLAIAVVRGIDLLGDLRGLHPDVGSGALEDALRREVSRLLAPGMPGNHPSIAAVRAACAHLRVRAHEEAHLALLTAETLLPRYAPGRVRGATP